MNRRSFGVKESRPPQRMRSSEYNFSGSSGQEGGARVGRPAARSMAGWAPQPPSTGKRTGSQSRLPIPGVKGKGPSAGKRSSSSGGPMAERNMNRQMLTTPRSSSSHNTRATIGSTGKRDSYITPQRYQGSNRKSVVQSSSSSKHSASLGGQRLSGRSSTIGAKGSKDTRPLTDKTYQQSQVRKILDFLRQNNYENSSLTSKHFPLSSKEFVGVFNFMYVFIQPDCPNVLPFQRFEEIIIPLLKMLGYPGNLSKSNFLTLGSMHSWPTVLGSLAFLCDLAVLYTRKLSPNIIPIGFVNKDEQGFDLDRESKDKIAFFHYLDCFNEFNNGASEFPDQLQRLEDRMMENCDVTSESLDYLRQKASGLKNELVRLEEKPNNRVALLEARQNLEADRDKLMEYLSKMKIHNKEKVLEVERQTRTEEELKQRLQGLEAGIEELREACKSRRVPSLEAERSSVLLADYRRQVEQGRNNVEEVDKDIWQKEIQVSRGREVLEGIAKQFNTMSLEESLGGSDPLVLSVAGFRGGELVEEEGNARLRPELSELLKAGRAETRNKEREVQTEIANSEQMQEILRHKQAEAAQKKLEVKTLQDEIASLREVIEKEDVELDKEIAGLREVLHRFRSQERVNVEAKHRELAQLRKRLTQLQLTRQTEKEKGIEFLRKVCDKTVTYMEQCTGHRDQAARAVQSQALAVTDTIRASMTEMNDKVNMVIEDVEKELN